MTVPFLDLAWQEAVIREDRERRFAEIIAKTAFVLGPHVAEFERAFADYVGTVEMVGVSGGTHALTMIFDALGITTGDEVVMIPTTFFASASSVAATGATPVFADIDPETRDFDIAKLEAAITPRTKAILAVHLYGHPADLDALTRLADERGIALVEDASQAHGAKHAGKRVGSFGRAAAFSFYPGKNLGAYGDGGAVATNETAIATVARALRNQGCVERYDHTYLGYNGRLDALQAAVVSAKLPHLDAWNAWRRRIAARYLEAFAKLSLGLPPVRANAEPVWHLFVVEVPEGEREAFIAHLTEQGIATGKHYPIPVHLTPAFAHLGLGEGSYPAAEALAERAVSLPIFPGMTDEQTNAVIAAVRSYFHAMR